MVKDVQYGTTVRKSYSKIGEFLAMPNLIEVQKNSYQWFLDEGLREVFRDVSAITDYTGTIELSFIDYTMNDKPKYTVKECKERDATYAAPVKVKVRLRNRNTEEIKEQELYVGDLPVMTDTGVSSSPSWSVLPASTSPPSPTRPTNISSPPPSSRTGAHGWSMRPMPTIFSMSASTRTASFW